MKDQWIGAGDWDVRQKEEKEKEREEEEEKEEEKNKGIREDFVVSSLGD